MIKIDIDMGIGVDIMCNAKHMLTYMNATMSDKNPSIVYNKDMVILGEKNDFKVLVRNKLFRKKLKHYRKDIHRYLCMLENKKDDLNIVRYDGHKGWISSSEFKRLDEIELDVITYVFEVKHIKTEVQYTQFYLRYMDGLIDKILRNKDPYKNMKKLTKMMLQLAGVFNIIYR